MSWDPVKDAKKWFNRVKNEGENAFNRVKKEGEHAFNSVRREGQNCVGMLRDIGKQVSQEIESGAKSVGREVENGVRTAGREVEDAFEKKLPELLEDALEEMLKAVASGALDKALDIIQVAAPTSVDLKVGPVGLSIGDITNKIDTLQRWAHNPPTGHGDIREMIETLSPTAVSVEISVSLALLVVQSDSLELGITLNYETADFLNKIEEITGKF